MTTRRRLTLPPPYPPITTAETTDTHTGRVRYRFRGPRATGTIVIAPYHRGWEPLPSQIHLQFGDGPDHEREYRRTDRPRINGVSLIGGLIVDPDEFLTRTDPTRWLHFRRPTGPYTSTGAPERTSQYAAAIVHTLITTWCTRPDRADLIRAGARHAAARRLHELYRSAINPTRDRIDTLTGELAEHHQTATALCALAGEYHHLHGDGQPAAAPENGTGW